MVSTQRGVVLVGHGGIPKDCPQELVARLKRLEAQRRAAHTPPSQEEIELDGRIRRWPIRCVRISTAAFAAASMARRRSSSMASGPTRATDMTICSNCCRAR